MHSWSQAIDLTGRTVLGVGCNAGFEAIEMRQRGAARVVAVDADDTSLRQAELAARVAGCDDIEFRNLSVYDVASLGERFDVVIFSGVLSHLRHPLRALDTLYDHVVGDVLIFHGTQRGSGEGYPLMYFVENRCAGEPASWWIPNRACVEGMLCSAGFVIEQNPEDEVYVCRRGERLSLGAA